MAIGMSLMFNIKLPINFNSPYKARDIQDFWRRWHMTLSRFLRDYIYIPLGGNRLGKLRNYFNLFSVFLIGGLWHGASWMFVIWGALHGGAIVIHRIWKDLGLRMWGWLGWFITFNFVNIAWVFFRAKDMEVAKKVLSGMAGMCGVTISEKMHSKVLDFFENFGLSFSQLYGNTAISEKTIYWVVVIFIILGFKNSNEKASAMSINAKNILFITILTVASIITMLQITSEFLYFNF
jgi:D-alanyl-lipoteichoic acid acyltransferase DltB (MBOAT superfamily)